MAQPLSALVRAGLVAVVMASFGCSLVLGLEDPKDRGAGGSGGNSGSVASTGSGASGGTGGAHCEHPASDCPAPQTKCVVAICDGTACGTENALAGTSCDDGGKVCDGEGKCVACVDAEMDCPATGEDCVVATCVAGVCGTGNAPDLTPTTTGQIVGDCKQQVCDGSGLTKIVNDDDPSDDGKDCTIDSCNGGMNVLTTAAAGTVCAQDGGKKCGSGNKLGACVECLTNADCAIPNPVCDTASDNFKCVPAGCTDGFKNGNETGLDCGGPICGNCPNGQGCNAADDCVSNHCAGNICTACANDAGCPVAEYCNAGVCTVDQANGAACASAAQCVSGSCVDGFCCNNGCGGPCQACSAAKKGQGLDGTCGPIAVSNDPDNECATDAMSTCDKTGFCDGAGACQNYPGGTQCAAPTCSGNSAAGASTCDGVGNCDPGGLTLCAPYVCNAGACPVMCSGDVQCVAGYYCSGSMCVAKKADGQSCGMNSECTSQSCVDMVCCNNNCNGPCQACSVAKKGQGLNGVCGSILAGSDPDNECAVDAVSTCGKDGFCDGTGQCEKYPVGTQCMPPGCVGGFQQGASQCTAGGICSGGAGVSCMPYACNAMGTACLSSCTVDANCSANYYCNNMFCSLKLGQGSACGGNSQCMSNNCVDNVCCGSPSCSTCATCNGSSPGTCTIIPTGQSDPGTCNAPMVCSAAQACVGCVSDAQCLGATKKCNIVTNTCVACLGDADCLMPGMTKCKAATHTCVQCVDNSTCSAPTPTCNAATYTCM